MEPIDTTLKKIVELQKFCAKRGLQFILANGYNRTLWETPDFDFEPDRVTMTFREKTNHDCPERQEITLGVKQLMASEEVWDRMISGMKSSFLKEKERIQKERDTREKEKRRQEFERLKNEFQS